MTTTAVVINIIFISMFLDGGSIACFLFLVNMVSSNYLLEVHVMKGIQCSLELHWENSCWCMSVRWAHVQEAKTGT